MSNNKDTWPPKFERYGVTLSPIEPEHLEMIRQWRNSPSIQQYMLDQREISQVQQQAWYSGLIKDKSRLYWLIIFKNTPIGVASILGVDETRDSGEPGLYIYPEQYRSNIVPFCVAFALNDMAFFELGLKRLDAIVLSENSAALRFNVKCGYQQNGEQTKGQIGMTLKPDAYIAARDPLARFIRY
ncbi:GNAT family N-acetyltransferase [Shewanella psychropiezotolerans]|uniref:GNAT family N-acetyltransferase n=1 Tax=Shewanella psychropiezotolerans TaxID=2593655 RepID=A0ABX5WWJ5_9GAMM|nr:MULTISPECIES: GNAT family N-acetyltransferase [Shewanella]MPY24949.1 GNAT family N-acetyltransferase [Shewanella sp. YLB-07]QDO83419.1 GNAT family N-acetyltransferase [Shewanella psychropiezotolerans]